LDDIGGVDEVGGVDDLGGGVCGVDDVDGVEVPNSCSGVYVGAWGADSLLVLT